MGALYQISLPNGKAYIGMTVCPPEKRFAEHRYQTKNGCELAVNRAMRKHGDPQFKVLVIAEDRQYLEDLERRAIVVFGTRSPGGYNLTDGGDGAPVGNQYNVGKKRTAESRAKMSASALGKKLTDITKAKMSAVLMGNKRSLGHRMTEEEKQRHSVACRGKMHKGCGTSGHVGVSFCKASKKWKAHITVRGKYISLGVHRFIEDAIAARAAMDNTL